MLSEPIHTLADLDTWTFPGAALAVLGHPIKHSISPPMQNAAIRDMAARDPRFASWQYFRFDIAPEILPAALERFHARGFKGINLTVPHKIIACNLPSVKVDASAAPIGAVNTLVRTETGWTGFNTDGHGLASAVREDLSLDLAGTPVVLLGAGGAARGAAVECLARGCRGLWIANRTRANLDALLAQLAPLAGAIPLHGLDPSAPPATLPAGALVINATSSGLHPSDTPPVQLDAFPRPAGVFDMIYNPPETALLARARTLGLPAANGLAMLVHQGVRSLEIWSGAPVPVAVMRAAAQAALKGARS